MAKQRDWSKSTLAERVGHVMKVMGWSEAELTRQIGAKGQSTVQHWLIGRNKKMQSRFAWPLQDNHHWSARWLLDGDGEPRIDYVAAEKEKLVTRVGTLPVDRLKQLVKALGV